MKRSIIPEPQANLENSRDASSRFRSYSVTRPTAEEESIYVQWTTALLAPDVLINLASSIVLQAGRNQEDLGALDEAELRRGGYEFPELLKLEADERDILLDAATSLFLNRNLCFRETLGRRTFLVFPALIKQKRPNMEARETKEDAAHRITGAVENVYAALVVLLGYTNTFTRTNHWHHQAQYET